MAAARPTFEVDKKGMAEVFARKGKAFVVTELIQNAWDEETSHVDITLEPLGHGKVRLVVEDDNPEGFKDLSHAFTLFAPSAKKSDVRKRGRFNLGEKLVIAICDKASIETTKGTILFNDKGRVHSTKKRKKGTRFTGVLNLTADDVKEVERVVQTLLPPAGITTTFNMIDVKPRKPKRIFEVSLRTEVADEDGRLKPTTRKTLVEVFEPRQGEVPSVYELGIPVVETGDRFHVNIGQKVPLPLDRDNLPPAYLRHLRVEVLNHVYDLLSRDDSTAEWVTNALEDDRVSKGAAQSVFALRFGEKVVIADPNDPEANKRAAAEGYSVITGGVLPKAAWKNVKDHGLALPAGQVTPSPKGLEAEGKNAKVVDPDHYTRDIENIVEFSKVFGRELLGKDIQVKVINEPKLGFGACFTFKGTGLTFNLGRLGHRFFDVQTPEDARIVIDLLMDEFGHHYASDHLDVKYYKALRRLGAKSVVLAFEKPWVYERLGFIAVGTEFVGPYNVDQVEVKVA
jgi:hypothetical protein